MKVFKILTILVIAMSLIASKEFELDDQGQQIIDPIEIDMEAELECLSLCEEGQHECIFTCIITQCQTDCEEQEPDNELCFDHCVDKNIEFPQDLPEFESCIDGCDMDPQCFVDCTEGFCDIIPDSLEEQKAACVEDIDCQLSCAEHMADYEEPAEFEVCRSHCLYPEQDRRLAQDDQLLPKSSVKTPINYGDDIIPPWPCKKGIDWSNPEQVARKAGCQLAANLAHDHVSVVWCACMDRLRRLEQDFTQINSTDYSHLSQYAYKSSYLEESIRSSIANKTSSWSLSSIILIASLAILLTTAAVAYKTHQNKIQQQADINEPYIRMPLLKD